MSTPEKKRKPKPLDKAGARWIGNYLVSDILISRTGFELDIARAKLLSGYTFEECRWLMIDGMTFRGLGSVSDVAGENRLYLGHLVNEKGKAVPAMVGEVWLDASVMKGDNSLVMRVLVQTGMVKRESEQVFFGEWQSRESGGRMVHVVKYAMKLLPGNFEELVTGKYWTINE